MNSSDLYTDPASHPAIEIEPNVVMIVGTGGIGIWERTWRETAHALTGKSEYELLSEANVTGPIRAMYIAMAAAFRSSQKHPETGPPVLRAHPHG